MQFIKDGIAMIDMDDHIISSQTEAERILKLRLFLQAATDYGL